MHAKCRSAHRWGSSVITFTVMCLTTAVLMTPRSDALRKRVVLALARAGISHKEAAIRMRLTESRLSEALNGRSPLSVWRLADLPDDFWIAFTELEAEARDGVALMAPQLARLVRGVDRLVMAHCEIPEGGALDRMINPIKAVS